MPSLKLVIALAFPEDKVFSSYMLYSVAFKANYSFGDLPATITACIISLYTAVCGQNGKQKGFKSTPAQQACHLAATCHHMEHADTVPNQQAQSVDCTASQHNCRIISVSPLTRGKTNTIANRPANTNLN